MRVGTGLRKVDLWVDPCHTWVHGGHWWSVPRSIVSRRGRTAPVDLEPAELDGHICIDS